MFYMLCTFEPRDNKIRVYLPCESIARFSKVTRPREKVNQTQRRGTTDSENFSTTWRSSLILLDGCWLNYIDVDLQMII